MTHVPAYYRARRDAERAWRASHPQYTIEGFQDALDEADERVPVGLVERVVGRDCPPGDVGAALTSPSPPGTVPPSLELTSGAEPCCDERSGTDGSVPVTAAPAHPPLGAGASAPIQTTGPGRTPPKEVRGQGQGGHPK